VVTAETAGQSAAMRTKSTVHCELPGELATAGVRPLAFERASSDASACQSDEAGVFTSYSLHAVDRRGARRATNSTAAAMPATIRRLAAPKGARLRRSSASFGRASSGRESGAGPLEQPAIEA
jgi:hypothetical protein